VKRLDVHQNKAGNHTHRNTEKMIQLATHSMQLSGSYANNPKRTSSNTTNPKTTTDN